MTVRRLHFSALFPPAGLEIDVNRHVTSGDLEAHDHDFVEVTLIVGGQALHETLYGPRPVGRGDAFVIRPGAWHAYLRCERLAVVNCCFRARLLERELLWLAEEPRLRFLLWPGGGAGDGVVRLRLPPAELDDADARLRTLAMVPAEGARAHQLGHLLLLLRGLSCRLDADQLAHAERLASAPAAVAQALRLLAGDLVRPWTVEELAAAVSVSPAHLSRLFRAAVGRPPVAHLSVLRAEAAATRLLRTPEPVSTVGGAVGWGDPNYFARRFRAHFGMSPTAYRAAFRRAPAAAA